MVARRYQGEGAAQSARSLPDAFRRALGRGARHLPRTLPDHPPRPADAAARPGGNAADLAGQGIFLGIVSNKTGELLRREVARLGWSGYFGSIVGAGDAPADKPACEPVHLALASSGVPAGAEVWFVGDTAVDIECARNSGCVGVLLAEAMPTEAFAREFSRFAPDLSFARRGRSVSRNPGVALRGHAPIFVGDRAPFGHSTAELPSRLPRLQERWGDHPCRPRNRKTFKTCS